MRIWRPFGLTALVALLALPHVAFAEDEVTTRWGAGARLRSVHMPTAVLELFVDHAQPMHSVGFGLQAVRRKGDFDIVFGLEFENVEADEGFWRDNDGDVDLVTYDNLALLGFDATFVWHAKLHDLVQFRYGAGVGIGAVLGKVFQADAVCPPGADLDDDTACQVVGPAVESDSVPPVVPIVNVLVGLRIKPIDSFTINVEAGFRDMFFLGVGADYFFD